MKYELPFRRSNRQRLHRRLKSCHKIHATDKSQIQSYLEDRDVTPTRITIFQSKRKGTISAKVNIPSVSLPLVQHEHFWPKFVTCKPWRSNLNGKKADAKPRMARSGNFSTYV